MIVKKKKPRKLWTIIIVTKSERRNQIIYVQRKLC